MYKGIAEYKTFEISQYRPMKTLLDLAYIKIVFLSKLKFKHTSRLRELMHVALMQ